jgi:hypothetical protein
MKLPLRFCLFILLFLTACESTQDKITRLQSELLTALGERDCFEIKTDKKTWQLPLPPAPELLESRKIAITAIMKEAFFLHTKQLNPADKNRLMVLTNQLNAILATGNNVFFDPLKCVLPKDLCAVLESGDTGTAHILLQKIPEYYTEVERRWQKPDHMRAATAAGQSMAILDVLANTSGMTDPARMSVKDFICLCRSACLLD